MSNFINKIVKLRYKIELGFLKVPILVQHSLLTFPKMGIRLGVKKNGSTIEQGCPFSPWKMKKL